MSQSCCALFVLEVVVQASAMLAFADRDHDKEIENERMRFQGTWRIVSLMVDGNKSPEDDASKFMVINASDGTWTLLSDERELLKGRSLFDPSQTPKTVDILVTKKDDSGEERHLGIYEISENARRLCFAPPGRERPAEFASETGSQHILVTFRRETVKPRGAAGVSVPSQ